MDEEKLETKDRYELTPEEIADNLQKVRSTVEEACRRVNRDPSEVRVCAVSKLKSVQDIQSAMQAGQHLFGENYVQEIREKYEALGENCEWHMIGHLQRNKVKYIVDKVRMIHSVDSLELAKQIEKEAAKHDLVMDVLLEVNVAREETKWGFSMDEVLDAAREIGAMPHVRVRGLMTSAPYTEDAETNRVYFRMLREQFAALQKAGFEGVLADTLSMGMTGDYRVAVEEGSTMIRVGTGIFGQRDYSGRASSSERNNS